MLKTKNLFANNKQFELDENDFKFTFSFLKRDNIYYKNKNFFISYGNIKEYYFCIQKSHIFEYKNTNEVYLINGKKINDKNLYKKLVFWNDDGYIVCRTHNGINKSYLTHSNGKVFLSTKVKYGYSSDKKIPSNCLIIKDYKNPIFFYKNIIKKAIINDNISDDFPNNSIILPEVPILEHKRTKFELYGLEFYQTIVSGAYNLKCMTFFSPRKEFCDIYDEIALNALKIFSKTFKEEDIKKYEFTFMNSDIYLTHSTDLTFEQIITSKAYREDEICEKTGVNFFIFRVFTAQFSEIIRRSSEDYGDTRFFSSNNIFSYLRKYDNDFLNISNNLESLDKTYKYYHISPDNIIIKIPLFNFDFDVNEFIYYYYDRENDNDLREVTLTNEKETIDINDYIDDFLKYIETQFKKQFK